MIKSVAAPDKLIVPQSCEFLIPDAALLARVPEGSLRNWLARDVMRLGIRTSAGRVLLSLLDILQLEIMHDLAVRGGFKASDAAQIAEIAAERVRNHGTGSAEHGRPVLNLIIGWNEEGELLASFVDLVGPGFYRPPARKDGDDSYNPLRRAHLVLPLASMWADLILRNDELERVNKRAEAPGVI
jgi:hypothetical protein